ncbi:MAG: ATP-dependent metallopeptidase FtsH/Yme1/Tma family protein [Chloroflexota bacterium]|nr:MAG: ATP-dependent metallopeptidase FtsH/Yme1/Tma family protein [Chloroflexota bacterium]
MFKRGTFIWLALLILALVFNVIFYVYPRGAQRVDIPYSTFRDQVSAGNVVDVTMTGQSVTGSLKESVTWPPQGSNQVSSKDFITQLPPVQDDTLMPLLSQQGVVVTAKGDGGSWVSDLLVNLLPFLFFIGLMVLMFRQSQSGQKTVLGFGQSRARKYAEGAPRITFSDVAGVDEAKRELVEVVDFLRDPKRFHKIGARIPKGVLLVGPPGTGKTLLARAVAGEAGVPFFSISATEFVEMFVGVGASRVRDLFTQAKKSAPAIVFVDEIDAVGRQRGAGLGTVNDEREQTLNQLLVEMDGFEPNEEVIVVAATNRPDVLDPALLRPGRFDRRVTVERPDRKGREAILHIHTQGLSLDPSVDLDVVARSTPGFSGADLANLANEAALFAGRKNKTSVNMADFEEALDKILLGVATVRALGPAERQVVAYHEGGHALVASLLPNSDPLHKVTIVPHGQALGATQQLPIDEKHNYPMGYLLTRIKIALGGRAAEEMAFGEITTGAENDLRQATKLARHMVAHWGMSQEIGLLSFGSDEAQVFLGRDLVEHREYSETTASQIDHATKRIIDDAYAEVTTLIEAHRDTLNSLADALVQEEVLDAAQVNEIMRGGKASHRVKPDSDLDRPEVANPTGH